MKWTSKKSFTQFCVMIAIVFPLIICGFSSFGSSSGLTEGNNSQEIGKIFRLNEFTEDFGILKNNLNNFSIPTPVGWNITEMELNFTNINIEPEIYTIEDSGSVYRTVSGASYTTNKRIAMEFEIESAQYLDALDIFCYHSGSAFGNVYIQIQGFNEITHRPNETIFGSPVELNVSSTPDWYLQQFSAPIYLEVGSYFIVLEGRNMIQTSSEIHWRVNINPDVENLHSTLYWFEEPGNEYWLSSVQTRKFDCKLHLSEESEFWPEDINMGIEVAGREFDVNNSLLMNPNHGHSLLETIPLQITQSELFFNVFYDGSKSISFDVAYSMNLEHVLESPGNLTLSATQPNVWKVFPEISHVGDNHSVEFHYAENWYNISVSRNVTDISDLIHFSESSLLITNSSILNEYEWEIIGYSPLQSGIIESTTNEYDINENISISIILPISNGILDVYIENSSNIEIYRECQNITHPNVTINPIIDTIQLSGLFTIYAEFSNSTVGGVNSFSFYVHNHPQGFWDKYSAIIFFGGAFAAVVATTIVSSVAIKRYRDSSLRYRTRLERTLQSVDEGIIVVDPYLTIKSTNEKAQHLASRMKARIIGEKVDEIFRFEDKYKKNRTGNLVFHGLESQQIRNYFGEFVLTNDGGFRTPVSITVTPVKDRQGQVSEIILSFQDISQLLSAQKEFDKRHELETIGLIAAGIAHDFNNMLTAAIGSVSVAKLDDNMHEENKELLLDAETALVNATELTLQLLTVSKGGVAVKKGGNIVDIVKETVRFVLRGTKIGVDFKVGSDLHPISYNMGQICQVFNNLVINAKEAMPDGGNIIISFINTTISESSPLKIPAGKYLKISVNDQGSGIPPDVLPYIFEPYFTTKKNGSGLGLPTTYTIIKKHNGELMVDTKVGKGTTFRIYLPALN